MKSHLPKCAPGTPATVGETGKEKSERATLSSASGEERDLGVIFWIL